MTDFEKYVYNSYLRVLRSSSGHPFKYRENFDGFENNENYVYVKRLASFFHKHKNVDVNDFLKAPYGVYGTDKSFYLDFYCSHPAVKVYTLYIDKINDEDPDCSNQLLYIIDSFKFIRKFCSEVNISTHQYIAYKQAAIPDFIAHLKERKVSVYALLSLEGFERVFYSLEKDWLSFVFGDAYLNKLKLFKIRFLNSRKAMILAKKSFEKVENNLAEIK